jgi:uncharacterized protein (DUF2252 family)
MTSIFDRIKKFNENHLPDMVQLKYKAMSENAFRFFRGTCHLFYEDLSKVEKFPKSPPTWICGDLHLENFGCFKGNNRMEYFDLNDFDESVLAPCLWEVTRVLTSIYVAFDTLKINEVEASGMANLFLKRYIETLKAGKAYYIDPRTAKGIVRDFLKTVKKRKEKELLKKMIENGEGHFTIKIDNLTHFKVEDDLKKELTQHLTNWIKKTREWPNNYKVKDVAFRVAGTGSVGYRRYMFLLQSTKKKERFILVELKEAAKSSLSQFNKIPQPHWSSEAERVIAIKYRMQNISPALLSTLDFNGDNYVLQEMQPTADKINFQTIATNMRDLKLVLNNMAMLTASAQIRSGGIQGSAIIDQLVAFSQKRGWEKSIIEYSKNYAGLVIKDYHEFTADYKNSLGGF